MFNMRELSQRTAQVMKEISDSGEPALITLRGRFVALITPLTNGELESKLISAALADGVAETHQSLEDHPPLSTEDVARKLGIEVPSYGDRDVAK
jgi:antitoxin (DNA-binding transcriptional repressor) of toxin-antitoxin stability system